MVPVTRHVTELAPTALGLMLAIILPLSPLGTSSRAAETDPGMVLVPAGEFLMGSPAGIEGYRDERPQRRIFVSAFRIDRYEVTNSAYARFVQETGHPAPANRNPAVTLWEGNAPPPGIGEHPVVNVSWEDAAAFCRWAGKRLPTEAEWEKAARGTEGLPYPWGDTWVPSAANSASFWARRTVDFRTGQEWRAFWIEGEGARLVREHGVSGEVLTLPVGSFPQDRSPYGIFDMAGNAAEWVADWYHETYYQYGSLSDPQGPEQGLERAMRGGSWLKPAISLRTSYRDFGLPLDHPSGTGFRCAKDAR